MPEVYELKNRIEGLKSIHNITYAMQIVTISRLKRIISGLTRISDAADEVSSALKYLVTERQSLYKQLIREDLESSYDFLVIVFSNRGFCGSYNQDILNAALQLCKDNGLDFNTVSKLCIGKKAKETLKRLSVSNTDFAVSEKDIFSEAECLDVYRTVKSHVDRGARVRLVYFGFKSIVTQKIVTSSFFPPEHSEFPPFDELKPGVPEFVEQSMGETFDSLVDQYYFLKLLKVIRSGSSSEFSQRFLLMKGAVDNVKSLSDELLIELNKQRQAGITQEVSEIISTFKALSKER
ncbi:F0F1 ATP synthase subunit gamma [bacterium]|nr:F0F1 ATP synthase subunit gamma [bacterium]